MARIAPRSVVSVLGAATAPPTWVSGVAITGLRLLVGFLWLWNVFLEGAAGLQRGQADRTLLLDTSRSRFPGLPAAHLIARTRCATELHRVRLELELPPTARSSLIELCLATSMNLDVICPWIVTTPGWVSCDTWSTDFDAVQRVTWLGRWRQRAAGQASSDGVDRGSW
jgi:hypothetical protein